jgi:hypothetical protein
MSCQSGKDALGVDERRVTQVVKPFVREDLGAGLEPDCLAKLDTSNFSRASGVRIPTTPRSGHQAWMTWKGKPGSVRYEKLSS